MLLSEVTAFMSASYRDLPAESPPSFIPPSSTSVANPRTGLLRSGAEGVILNHPSPLSTCSTYEPALQTLMNYTDRTHTNKRKHQRNTPHHVPLIHNVAHAHPPTREAIVLTRRRQTWHQRHCHDPQSHAHPAHVLDSSPSAICTIIVAITTSQPKSLTAASQPGKSRDAVLQPQLPGSEQKHEDARSRPHRHLWHH